MLQNNTLSGFRNVLWQSWHGYDGNHVTCLFKINCTFVETNALPNVVFCVYAYRWTIYMSNVYFHRKGCNNPSSILSFIDVNFICEEKITATPLSQNMATLFTQYSPFPSFALCELLRLCFTVVRDWFIHVDRSTADVKNSLRYCQNLL